MHKRTLIWMAATAAVGLITSAHAQTDANAQQLERVEITGSAIKRLDAETAVPVTVIKVEELKAQGVTSVEQILGLLSSVQATQNMASAIGSGTGGVTYADMRGLGPSKTLVLLNGQRIANSATGSTAPDMNMIPFSAITRVEVLRDGASALYGTDAIGGVINFITRNDLTGGSISIGYDAPQKSGGTTNSASLTYGLGDLGKDGWNVFGTVSYKKRAGIDGDQRDFNKRIIGGLSNSTYPANYQVTNGGTYFSPVAPGCNAPNLIPNTSGPNSPGCRIVTPPFVSISPPSETMSGMLKGTFDVAPTLRLGAEVFYSKNAVETKIAPVPYGGYWLNPGTTYFPTGAQTNPDFDPYGAHGLPFNNPTTAFPNPINTQKGGVLVWWRDLINGPRSDKSTGELYRGLLTAEGTLANWDYRLAFAYNRTQNDRELTGGYADGDVIGEGLIRGIINPFGEQTAESLALIRGAALNGLLSTSIGTVKSFTAAASRELGDWFNATRPAAVALGAEFRTEDYHDFNHKEFATAVSASTGVDPNAFSRGDRKISAVYGELNVPFSKSFDITGSFRYDKYNDFGSTTNPKLAFRFQPMKELLLRGSASTGFRAPSLYELNASTGFTNTGSGFNNPLNCPNGVPNDESTRGANCDAQFQAYFGGNKDLKPEESKSFTLGLVFEPFRGLTASVDLWAIKVDNLIGTIPEETLFKSENYQIFQQYFHFVQPGNVLPQNTRSCQDGPTSPTCGYVDERTQNLGGVKTSGVDLGLQYQTTTAAGRVGLELQSTLVRTYEYQDYADGPWNKNIGVYSGAGPIFKWQHNVSASWAKDAWGAGLAVHYRSGYIDMDPSNKVKAYTTADAYVSFKPLKTVSLVAGVRNLTDREPPFSNQSALFQGGGWDSRFYDPVGRTVYVRGTVDF